MEEKKYNFKDEDSEYQEISKMLSELPKVKADDNFEFNLLAKIQNGNFDVKKYKESSIGWSWIYAPATALALSVILIFFVFNPESEQFDNPLMSNPPLRAAFASDSPDTMIANQASGSAVARNMNSSKNDTEGNRQNVEDSYVVVLQPNDVVVKEKMPYPFEDGVDLDNYVGGNELKGQSRSQLAGYGNSFDFDGFFIRINPNNEKILLEKARLDSLQKLQKMDETK